MRLPPTGGLDWRSSPTLRHVALAIAIILIGGVAYMPALSAGFVWDDAELVTSNPLVKGALRHVWTSTDAADYWPLTITTFWLEWRIWGAHPAGYHAVNVALHLTAGLLLWRVLKALSIPGAWLAALLFTVHPVTVESVAWISERKNTLSAVFFFATLLMWLRHEHTGRRRDLLGAIGLFGAGLLAKTSIVMLPVVLVGLTWWRTGELRRAVRWALAPFFALSALAGAATIWFQHHNAMGGEYTARGVGERLGGAAWALARYVETAFVPVRIGVVYPPWPTESTSPWYYVPLLVLTAALSGALILCRRTTWPRAALAAIAYHVVMVAPVLGVIDIAYILRVGPISNHLQYLALVGPISLLAGSLAHASERRRIMAPLGAAVIVALFMTHTFRRSAAYESQLTLWTRATEEAPRSAFAHVNLSAVLRDAGDLAGWTSSLQEAARVGTAQRRAWALMFLAVATRRPDEAALHAREVLRLPGDREHRWDAAKVLLETGYTDEGIEALAALFDEAPRNCEYPYRLAASLNRLGRLDAALDVLQRSSKANPHCADVEAALSILLARKELPERAR